MVEDNRFDKVLSSNYEEDNENLVKRLHKACSGQGLTLAVAESMTSGMLSAEVTSLPGASNFFLGGAVCYHPKAKYLLAGVDPKIIKVHGAVSEQVTEELARGIRKRLSADIGVAITGVAGPGPGKYDNAGLPGTVYISIVLQNKVIVKSYKFEGERTKIRNAAVRAAIRLLLISLREIGG